MVTEAGAFGAVAPLTIRTQTNPLGIAGKRPLRKRVPPALHLFVRAQSLPDPGPWIILPQRTPHRGASLARAPNNAAK
jgi:hypothetical protein